MFASSSKSIHKNHNNTSRTVLRDKRRVLMAFNEMQISDDGTAVYPPTRPTWEHTFTVNGERMSVFNARPGGESSVQCTYLFIFNIE